MIRDHAQQTGDPLILENKSHLYNAGVQNGLEEYCSSMSWACCNRKPNLQELVWGKYVCRYQPLFPAGVQGQVLGGAQSRAGT